MTPAQFARSTPQPATTPRRIAILGATGSVARSTVDLIKSETGFFIVEAVGNAHRNALRPWRRTAREIGAKFAVVAEFDASYGELEGRRCQGSGIPKWRRARVLSLRPHNVPPTG